MKKILTYLLPLLAIVASCKKENGKIVEKYGGFYGRVIDSYGTPIPNATIILNPGDSSVRTDNNGFYRAERATVGSHAVIAAAENFISQTQNVSIVEDKYSLLDFILKTGTATLNLSVDSVKVFSVGGMENLTIKSNSSWSVSTQTPWIKIKTINADGNSSLYFECAENSLTDIRKGTIEITTGTVTKKVTVIQNSSIKIVSQTEPNNELLNDSITVIFNKEISLTNLKSNFEFCVTEMGYRYVENKKGIRFSYGCAQLGGSYPFTIKVTDSFNESFSRDFQITYYRSKINLETIFDMFITPDNKSCWVATVHQDNSGNVINKIVSVSIPDLQITKEYRLDFSIGTIKYNHFNNLLYITSADEPVIYKMNLKTGSIVEKIDIKPLPEDNYLYPNIMPSTIHFLNNGYGTIGVYAKQSSSSTWRIIDSRDNDKMSFHPVEKNLPWLITEGTNYDRSVLYLTDGRNRSDLYMIDGKTQQAKLLKLPVKGQIAYVVPSLVNNNVLIQQLDQQYFYNPITGYVGNISRLGYGSATLNYKAGEEESVYTLMPSRYSSGNYDHISLLDLKSNTNKISFPITSELRNWLFSTTDGKYIITRSQSYLHVLNTSMFSK